MLVSCSYQFHSGTTFLPLPGTSGLPLDRHLIPIRSHQVHLKRICFGDLARGIYMIRITLEILAIVIFVVILLSR